MKASFFSVGLVTILSAAVVVGTAKARGPGGGGGGGRGGPSGGNAGGHGGGGGPAGGNSSPGASANFGGGNASSKVNAGRTSSGISNRTPTFSAPHSFGGPSGPQRSMSNGPTGPNLPKSNPAFTGRNNLPRSAGAPFQKPSTAANGAPSGSNRAAFSASGGPGQSRTNVPGNSSRANNANSGYRPSYADHSFYHGYWNNHYGSGGNKNNAAGYGQNSGYGRLNGFGYGQNGYGLGGYGGNSGFGGYGGYGMGGGGLGGLLQIGLALAGGGGGLGGGYGLGGFGGGYGSGLGGYGGYGLLGGYPIGWGFGGGGLGRMAYSSGYLPYSNPYYSSGMAGYNYTQPIPTAIAANSAPTTSQLFDDALAQFKAGDYTTALISVDNAIQQNPSDAVMHEFRALDLFALKNYKGAAATIHSVVAVGPGWDWTTLSSLYSDVDVYEAQLRSLEQAVKADPNQADTRFLLAYHYMTTGSTDAATKQLREVVRLAPTDRLAADLLKMNEVGETAQASQPVAPATTPTPPQQPVAAPKPIDPAALVGNWNAERSDGSKFGIHLAEDKTFTWKVNQQGHEENLTGTFGVENDLLAFDSPQTGGMVGHVSFVDNDHFTFKLLGAPKDDEGLTFAR